MMGNTVVWKPSDHQIFSAKIVIDIFREAGLPDGVINAVYGDPEMITNTILKSKYFAGIHFTGSTSVFKGLWKKIGGNIENYKTLAQDAKNNNVGIAVAADLLSITLLTPPGEWGADVVVGTTQRFGIPMGYGGPHAAYFATKESYKRNIPGRIIGVAIDAEGKRALRMALQTREQHIKREKATSNICTAQVLLSVMAGMYGVYHGPKRLKNIARKIHGLTCVLTEGLEQLGYKQLNKNIWKSKFKD